MTCRELPRDDGPKDIFWGAGIMSYDGDITFDEFIQEWNAAILLCIRSTQLGPNEL